MPLSKFEYIQWEDKALFSYPVLSRRRIELLFINRQFTITNIYIYIKIAEIEEKEIKILMFVIIFLPFEPE